MTAEQNIVVTPSSDDYVQIDRYVHSIDDTGSEPTRRSASVRRRRRSRSTSSRATLVDALKERKTDTLVLVAPSGAGKSTELRQQARLLRAAGEMVAFLEAASLFPLPGSEVEREEDEEEAFEALLRTQSGGVLVVDAIDQLRFSQVTIEQFFRRLGKRVPFRDLGIRLVLSTHTGAWTREIAEALTRFLRNWARSSRFDVITFEPLDLVAIERLAAGTHELTQGELVDFMNRIRAEEVAGLIDLRPNDVRLLVNMWKRSGALFSGAQLLERFVDASLLDDRGSRQRRQSLSGQQGRCGLERVAAASVLMRSPHVATPSQFDISGTVSSRRLFADWSPSDVNELFDNPLFAHKGSRADIVQLPQGSLSAALAASWLVKRSNAGLAPDSLRDLLLVRVFGESRYQVPLAHRELVGWLSSGHPEFRRLLGETEPAILLFDGDPNQLRDEEICTLLNALCRRHESAVASPAVYRRLARPSLEPDLRLLLENCEDTSRSLLCLIQLAEYGAYQSCSSRLAVIAASSDNATARMLAVRALASLGQTDVLVGLLGDQDPYVRAQLFEALVPGSLEGEALIEFLLENPRYPLPYVIKDVSARMRLTDIDALLVRLVGALSGSEIDAESAELFRLLPPVLFERLQRGADEQESCIDALLLVERHEPAYQVSEDDRDALETIIGTNRRFRRAAWRRRFARFEEDPQSIFGSMIGEVVAEDLEWLWEMMPSDHESSRRRPPSGVILDKLWQPMGERDRAAVLAGPLPEGLREYLQKELDRIAELQEANRSNEERRRIEMEPTIQENDAAVLAHRDAVVAGKAFGILEQCWHYIDSSTTHVNLTGLTKILSNDVAGVVARGLRVCWHNIDVSLRTPESRALIRYSLGLMSVTLDMPEFSNISEDDAVRAIRLGFHADNAFPGWYDELVRIRPREAKEQFRQQISWEWRDSTEFLGVLRLGSFADRNVLSAMRDVLLVLLDSGPPASERATGYVVDILLTSTTFAQKLISIARREVERSGSEMPSPQWLRLWAHVEPESAAAWIGARIKAGHEAVSAYMKVFSLLERDLDERARLTVGTWLMEPRALHRWIKLLLEVVRPQDDIRHHGVYSPGDRDEAQDFRYRCLMQISHIPTTDARAVLLELKSDRALTGVADVIEDAIRRQYQAAVEAAARTWTESDVAEVESGDEKCPRSLQELFDLVRNHITHVHRLVANDDFSYRDLFVPKTRDGRSKRKLAERRRPKPKWAVRQGSTHHTKEREIQLWVACCLRERSRGLYSVIRENVLDDDKEVDVSAFVPGVGQIPIEIKPLGDLPVAQLERVIRTQLLGRYMRPPDRRYGILLLVRRDIKTWKLNGRNMELDGLLEHLQSYAIEMGAQYGKTIVVEKIDLRESSGPG